MNSWLTAPRLRLSASFMKSIDCDSRSVKYFGERPMGVFLRLVSGMPPCQNHWPMRPIRPDIRAALASRTAETTRRTVVVGSACVSLAPNHAPMMAVGPMDAASTNACVGDIPSGSVETFAIAPIVAVKHMTVALAAIANRMGNLAKPCSSGTMMTSKIRADMPVPMGFVVTTAAYKQFMAKHCLNEIVEELLDNIDVNDNNVLTKVASEIQELILSRSIPISISRLIKSDYKSLPERLVAVRSSATLRSIPSGFTALEVIHSPYVRPMILTS